MEQRDTRERTSLSLEFESRMSQVALIITTDRSGPEVLSATCGTGINRCLTDEIQADDKDNE